MLLFKQKEPLRLLSKIIQLFSLTKNLNREQWAVLEKDFWRVIAKDISLIFAKQPLVQFWNINRLTDNATVLANSKQLLGANLNDVKRPELAEKGCIFDINDELFLYLEIPFLELTEEQKMLLCTIVDHLKTSQEWRDSLEHGFEIQKRIDLLHKITVSIRSSLNLSDVLAVTAKDLGESLKVSRCFIRRYDPVIPGKVLATEEEFVDLGYMKAADIIFDFENEWMKNLSQLTSKNLSGEEHSMDAESVILYYPNVQNLPDPEGFIKSLAEAIDLKTFLGVPLLYNGMILGSLCFHQCRNERAFHKHELEFIRQVADEAAVAIVHAQMYSHIQREAKTDSLTGLHNKASFHENLDKEIERVKRNNGDISLMMIDLDFLKKANDTFGHMVGDEMIQMLGNKLKQVLRQLDIIARFGGDEFGVILTDTPFGGAKLLGQRLVTEILSTVHPLAGNLSVSIGIAGTPLKDINKDKLIELADKSLYLAKQKGKGRACGADELLSP